MRYITLAAIALLVLSAGAGRSRGGILLEQGQRYDFSFDTLHLAGTETGVNQGGFTAYLGAGNALDTGDDVRVDLFQNAFSDPAFYSHDFTTPTTLFAATVVSPTPWQDLQGKL